MDIEGNRWRAFGQNCTLARDFNNARDFVLFHGATRYPTSLVYFYLQGGKIPFCIFRKDARETTKRSFRRS